MLLPIPPSLQHVAATGRGRCEGLITDAHSAIGQVRTLIDQVNAGQAPGMLAKYPALYKEANATMTRRGDSGKNPIICPGQRGQIDQRRFLPQDAKLSLQKLDKATEGWGPGASERWWGF